jgi:hypothetical protein
MVARDVGTSIMLKMTMGHMLSMIIAVAGTVLAAEFRVDNKVFTPDRQEPISQSTTIFYAGAAYDFLASPRESTIINLTVGRITLLDAARQLQTELSAAEVKAFVERLKQEASAHPEPALRFFAAPQFEEQYDADGGLLTLKSPWLIYEVTADRPEEKELVRQYHEFSDWMARLNTLLNPGARPPTARLQLNQAMVQRGLLPKKVVLTIIQSSGGRSSPAPAKNTIRTEHTLVPKLDASDLARIAAAQKAVREFRTTSFDVYRQFRKR